ncbi:MAG: nascent polypeptide-associated complex protein [Nanoarchaeota archaeon]|nr:nascent polypeptide-associated complex protein [Nanoarchaeota archaeon]
MIPGMNPRKMQQMMRRMGIQQSDIDAKQVIIKCGDKDIVINNPQVAKVNMMGQETYQVVGEAEEVEASKEPEINEDDIKTVSEQGNCSEEQAKEAIKRNKGDLAAAIIELKKE